MGTSQVGPGAAATHSAAPVHTRDPAGSAVPASVPAEPGDSGVITGPPQGEAACVGVEDQGTPAPLMLPAVPQ